MFQMQWNAALPAVQAKTNYYFAGMSTVSPTLLALFRPLSEFNVEDYKYILLMLRFFCEILTATFMSPPSAGVVWMVWAGLGPSIPRRSLHGYRPEAHGIFPLIGHGGHLQLNLFI